MRIAPCEGVSYVVVRPDDGWEGDAQLPIQLRSPIRTRDEERRGDIACEVRGCRPKPAGHGVRRPGPPTGAVLSTQHSVTADGKE